MYDYFILLLINKELEWEYCRYGKVYLFQHIMFNTKVGTNGEGLNLFKTNYNPFYEKGVVRVIELWKMSPYKYKNIVTVLSWAFDMIEFCIPIL